MCLAFQMAASQQHLKQAKRYISKLELVCRVLDQFYMVEAGELISQTSQRIA